jgi:pimeloyl-ACP methyl ester carboxylesterase
MSTERAVIAGGVELSVTDDGDGPAVLLLHGLTATRRYVVMGSTALQRGGHRVVAFDARGHGRSSPGPAAEAYGYELLAADALAVMDALGIERAVLAGASMGAHTLLRVALTAPARVAGLVVITPAYDGDPSEVEGRFDRWDALAAGLRAGGVEGFLDAYGVPPVALGLRDTVLKVIRQRLALHEHPDAVADALQAVPRSRPFERLEALRAIGAPTVVVASSDGADPEHPEAIGRAYAETIPGARLVTDPPGSSPIAWQGSQLSRLIAEVVRDAGLTRT